ncbi:2OG-Fe(II) oxygenase [Zavarzinia compransoris]|uniref:2OG-Fe(II) oxygenase n=1 Tax=Zavarzinia marina TaxID=2911065 RepID=UPI001F38C8AE|nr:2OG-Fe(II) oxygenase [Zavarzinia marina]MCF4164737.1 2OG-Fe(II) oxygenase [Zavarzinia marina]
MSTTTTPTDGTAPATRRYVRLLPGDPAPWFRQATAANPRFSFDTVAGRYIVLLFHLSAGDGLSRAALDAVAANRHLFDDAKVSFFGVTLDREDSRQGRVPDMIPGIRHFLDFDGTVARAYGAVPETAETVTPEDTRRFWLILDPMLRVLDVVAMRPDGADRDAVLKRIADLPPVARFAGRPIQAPVLFLPHVFEPALCRRLIDHYESVGGRESGFMRDVDGKTTLVHDHSHKRRRDVEIADAALIRETQARIRRRVVPEIRKVHQFEVTRMERYLIGCYEAADQGHFRPHRDNTTRGTAHRRFAVSINLNDDFEGGDVFFPEYGPDGMVPPPGGAVVFSCSLLHSVRPVTRGRRFAFLPFLYDEAAARLRSENNQFLADGIGSYRDGLPPEDRSSET